jgi:hypothetical protein
MELKSAYVKEIWRRLSFSDVLDEIIANMKGKKQISKIDGLRSLT